MEEIIKLERIKLPSACSLSSEENIFREVSEKTGAVVHLETGCKTLPRKEPFIKLTGPEECVQKAKDMLIDKMELQCNRVMMKIDVTHVEHPSLIGKGGKLIKKVMDTTGCHIHFPDANKCSALEKSNQVSIYGDPANVERARIMLRALIPVQMHFEVPVTRASAECKLLASINGLHIYSAGLPSSTLIIMKCNQDQFSNLRKEIIMCMETLSCKKESNLPPVQMETNILHHHHIYVKGNNNSNIEGIMKRTGAKIIFPDISTPVSEKNTVKIIGSVDCVYMAWQEIMNYLPVSVSFDINITRETRGDYLDFLEDCGITVYSCPKPKYFIKNVTVKGCEKYSKQMLQYRQHLLRLPSVSFQTDIDDINLASKFLRDLTQYFNSSMTNAIPASVSSVASKALHFGVLQQFVLETALQEQYLGFRNHYLQANPLTLSSVQTQLKNDVQALLARHSEFNDNEEIAGQSSLSSSPSNDSQGLHESHDLLTEENKYDISFSEMDYYRKKVQAAKAMRRPIKSMESAQVPSSLWAGYGFSQSMPASVIKDNLEVPDQFSYFQFNNGSSDSGSQDSDAWENIVLKDCQDGNIWFNKKESAFSHSNYFDFLRNMPLPFDCTTKDILPELLWQHGLHKYIDLFTREEINYQTFLLLTDEDLQGLGISYQARVKLMCLIRELQDERKLLPKTFNAAPGAGRKQQ